MKIPRLPEKARLPAAFALVGLASAGAALAAAMWWPSAQDALGLIDAPEAGKPETRVKFEDAAPSDSTGAAMFPLTKEGRKIVDDALAFRRVPGIIPADRRGEALCAGFDFGLSEKLWGPTAPYRIGMMNPKTKKPSDAWELPWSYAWYGGTVLADFSPELRKWRADYISHVELARWKDFFRAALSPGARLGDVGFLFRDTGFVAAMNGEYFNSHIGKVMGMTEFSYPVPETAGTGAAQAVAAALGCRPDFFAVLAPVLEHYEISLDGKPAEWRAGMLLVRGRRGWETASPLPFSTVTVRDAAVAHFFQTQSRVDGLFALACQGQLLPANVTEINPRLAGK